MEEERFISTGPGIVGFEIGPYSQSDWLAIGVGAWGTTCGVHGVGGPITTAALMASPNPDPTVSPNDKITRVPAIPGVGVSGLGDAVGVRGAGPFGVSGAGTVEGVRGAGPIGVNGIGTVEGVRGAGPIGVNGAGVLEGVHGAGLFGVIGVSTGVGNGTGIRGDGAIGVEGVGTVNGVLGFGTGGSGVSGGSDRFFGVVGTSNRNRGGVFGIPENITESDFEAITSGPVPQLCLAAVILANPDVQSQLPRAGTAGDLLAVAPPGVKGRVPQAQLWFCVTTGSNAPGSAGASWAQVQLGPTVNVP